MYINRIVDVGNLTTDVYLNIFNKSSVAAVIVKTLGSINCWHYFDEILFLRSKIAALELTILFDMRSVYV